jgi:multidrug efflux pump subunit AcrB
MLSSIFVDRPRLAIVIAATEGARLRFRPVMMTSFAFILGL